MKSFLYRRRHEKEQGSFSEHCAKMIAGLRSPHPRFLSSRKERNQRFAKEEVSSLETPLRGTSPRELRKRSSLPLSAPPARRCQVLHLPLRAAEFLCRAHALPIYGGSKGSSMTPSLEIQKPGGFWCALCETFFTQESFRGCGLRKPAMWSAGTTLQRRLRAWAAPKARI